MQNHGTIIWVVTVTKNYRFSSLSLFLMFAGAPSGPRGPTVVAAGAALVAATAGAWRLRGRRRRAGVVRFAEFHAPGCRATAFEVGTHHPH